MQMYKRDISDKFFRMCSRIIFVANCASPMLILHKKPFMFILCVNTFIIDSI
jgi:hypothetical protein